MRYRSEILAAYADIFADAHTQTKQAGVLRGIASTPRRLYEGVKGFGRGVSGRASQEATQAARNAEELQRVTQSLSAADLDAAASQALRDRAERELARLGAKPGALTDAERAATLGKGLGLAGLGAAGVGIPAAYLTGRDEGDADRTRTRNMAFGVGAASGLAAPHILSGLGRIARGVGGTGLFPELQGLSPERY